MVNKNICLENTAIMGNEAFLIYALKEVISQVDAFYVPEHSSRIENLDKLMFLRELLQDSSSRNEYDKLLIKILAMEFMAKKRACARFKVHSDEYWEEIQKRIKSEDFCLPQMDNYGDYGDNVIFKESFAMDPYTYKDICCVKEGDVVIDCGAYVGDTAYVFHQKMRGNGLVYAFEPLPENYEKLISNISKSDLKDIIPINLGVGDETAKLKFSCNENNHGASRISADGTVEVGITTIDSFFESRNEMTKIDFIKMDIEGAEASALKGAEKVIRRFRPKMAICIYHKVQDYWEIPQIILDIDNRYEFYLRHHTENNTETVLFCIPVNHDPKKAEEKNYDNDLIKGIQELYISTHNKLRANANWSERKYKELENAFFNSATSRDTENYKKKNWIILENCKSKFHSLLMK